MFDFLLDEKNFTALKEYIRFLSDLPDSLVEVKKLSDDFRRRGHVLLSPPDAQALMLAASANERNWRGVVGIVPTLGVMSSQLFEQISTFVREFEQELQKAAVPASYQLLKDVDPQRFTPISSGSHDPFPPSDIVQLIGNLCLRLDQCTFIATYFKTLIVEVSQTIHRVFVRFIESMSLRLCACHSPVSKIEMYYRLGRIALPNMQYNLDGYYSQEQRVEKARAHLKALHSLYARAISAGNNLSDLCHRMAYFLNYVRGELQSNNLQKSVRWTRSSLSHIAYPLEELKVMANALVAISSKLKI